MNRIRRIRRDIKPYISNTYINYDPNTNKNNFPLAYQPIINQKINTLENEVANINVALAENINDNNGIENILNKQSCELNELECELHNAHCKIKKVDKKVKKLECKVCKLKKKCCGKKCRMPYMNPFPMCRNSVLGCPNVIRCCEKKCYKKKCYKKKCCPDKCSDKCSDKCCSDK